MNWTRNDHQRLLSIITLAFVGLTLVVCLGGCQAFAGLGRDLTDAANTIERAMRDDNYSTVH